MIFSIILRLKTKTNKQLKNKAMRTKTIFWTELTETQKEVFLNENKEYLFWADGTPISVNELSRFMLVFNGQFWSLTLKDEDFYIENVIFDDKVTNKLKK